MILLFLISCQPKSENQYRDSISKPDSLNISNLIDSANSYRIQGNLELAKSEIDKAIKQSKEFQWEKGLGSAYTNLSYINLYESDFESSMENAVKGLKISEKCNDKNTQGFANLLIGYVYFSLGDSNQVLPYYRKSLNIRKEIGNDYDIGFTYSYLGNYFFAIHRLDSTVFYHKKSLEHRIKCDDTRSIADSYLLLGSAELKLGNEALAQEYFQVALLKYSQIKDKKRLAETYRNYAEIYLSQGNLKDAENFLNQANILAKETGAIDNLILISDRLAEIKSQKGDYESAYDYLRYYINTSQAATGESKYKDIVKNVLAYKNEKEQKIRELEFQQAKERQNLIVLSVCMVSAMLLAFLFFVWSRLRITRNQNKVIAKQKGDVDKAFGELELKNKEIVDSINYAKRIQSAILPPMEQLKNKFNDIFVLYKPKDIVAGDFYWSQEIGNKKFIAVADCTGHGVPGAMVSVVCNSSLNRSIHEFGLETTNEILDKTRALVVEEFSKSSEHMSDGMDIALISMEKRDKNITLEFSGANNPLWIVRSNKEEIEEIKGDKQPIGEFIDSKPFKKYQVSVNKGDSIYLFSDGFIDQFGGAKCKKLKAKNFKSLILNLKNIEIKQQKNYLEEFFTQWKGEIEQLDDVCVIGLKI